MSSFIAGQDRRCPAPLRFVRPCRKQPGFWTFARVGFSRVAGCPRPRRSARRSPMCEAAQTWSPPLTDAALRRSLRSTGHRSARPSGPDRSVPPRRRGREARGRVIEVTGRADVSSIDNRHAGTPRGSSLEIEAVEPSPNRGKTMTCPMDADRRALRGSLKPRCPHSTTDVGTRRRGCPGWLARVGDGPHVSASGEVDGRQLTKRE